MSGSHQVARLPQEAHLSRWAFSFPAFHSCIYALAPDLQSPVFGRSIGCCGELPQVRTFFLGLTPDLTGLVFSRLPVPLRCFSPACVRSACGPVASACAPSPSVNTPSLTWSFLVPAPGKDSAPRKSRRRRTVRPLRLFARLPRRTTAPGARERFQRERNSRLWLRDADAVRS